MALTSSFLRNGPKTGIDPNNDAVLAALKRELAGYVAAGNAERAAQVRKEIARLGGEEVETATAEPKVEQAVKPKARRRSKD